MSAKDFSQVADPVLRGSLTALRRAAAMARKTAIETDTYIVTVKDGQIRRISAEELRRDAASRNNE